MKNFHKTFNKSIIKTSIIGGLVMVLIQLSLLAAFIWSVVYVFKYYSTEENNLIKDTGKVFESFQKDFNAGRSEVKSDTLNFNDVK